MKGVAFKVTYNDGGAEVGDLVGYRGVCSDPIMLHNVRTKKNCSAANGPCRIFVERGFTGRRPSPGRDGRFCYESTLLSAKPWAFASGTYQKGERAGQSIPIRKVEPGDIAFLTTVVPGTGQSERIVFGLFRVGTVGRDEEGGNSVVSDGTMDVLLPNAVARSIRYWNYVANEDKSEKWDSGLFRYLCPANTQRLLADVLGALADNSERDVIYSALHKELPPRGPKLPSGGGESEGHRELKVHVANNPTAIGLPAAAKAHIEFPYTSGDCVDVKFDLPDGSFAVVEIETIMPYPGAHQCIKYRALLAAEHGLPLNTGRVRAILVAHDFDDETKAFAARYGIDLVAIAL